MPKLIYWGQNCFWDRDLIPPDDQKALDDPDKGNKNIQKIKNSPFHGHVFYVSFKRQDGGMHQHSWDNRETTYTDNDINYSAKCIAHACSVKITHRDDKQDGKMREYKARLTENFLTFTLAGAAVDPTPKNGGNDKKRRSLHLRDNDTSLKTWWNVSKTMIETGNHPPDSPDTVESDSAWQRVIKRAQQVGYIAGYSGCRGVLLDLESFSQLKGTQDARGEIKSAYASGDTNKGDAIAGTYRDKVSGLGRLFYLNLWEGFKTGRMDAFGVDLLLMSLWKSDGIPAIKDLQKISEDYGNVPILILIRQEDNQSGNKYSIFGSTDEKPWNVTSVDGATVKKFRFSFSGWPGLKPLKCDSNDQELCKFITSNGGLIHEAPYEYLEDKESWFNFVIYLDRSFYSLYGGFIDDFNRKFPNTTLSKEGIEWKSSDDYFHSCFLNGMLRWGNEKKGYPSIEVGVNVTIIDACERESYGVYGEGSDDTKHTSFDDIRWEWINRIYRSNYGAAVQSLSLYRNYYKIGFIFFLAGLRDRKDPYPWDATYEEGFKKMRLQLLSACSNCDEEKLDNDISPSGYLMIYTEQANDIDFYNVKYWNNQYIKDCYALLWEISGKNRTDLSSLLQWRERGFFPPKVQSLVTNKFAAQEQPASNNTVSGNSSPADIKIYSNDKDVSNTKANERTVQQATSLFHPSIKHRISPDGKEQQLEIDVPHDGSCLFYSVVLSMLLPVLNDQTRFTEYCNLLFDTTFSGAVDNLYSLLQRYDGDPTFIKSHASELEVLVDVHFRQKVVKYMRDNKAEFKNFVSENLDQYLDRMQKPKTWGDQPEIEAISRLLKRRITIYREESNRLTQTPDHSPEQNERIYLIYTGEANDKARSNTHYHFLIQPQFIKPGAIQTNASSSFVSVVSGETVSPSQIGLFAASASLIAPAKNDSNNNNENNKNKKTDTGISTVTIA